MIARSSSRGSRRFWSTTTSSLVALLTLAACGAKTGLEIPTREEEPDAGPSCIPRPEACNREDDDCDGAADDGIACFFLDGEPIDALETSTCGAPWYSYGSPHPESANPIPDIRRSGGVVLAVQHGPSCAGASVALITDLPMDGSGGALGATFDLDPPSAGGILVGDEPRECVVLAPGGRVRCDWVWQPCCTDGVLLGTFTEACVTVVTTAPSGVGAPIVRSGATREISRAHDVPFELCVQIRPAR